jgi:hypothetical protein
VLSFWICKFLANRKWQRSFSSNVVEISNCFVYCSLAKKLRFYFYPIFAEFYWSLVGIRFFSVLESILPRYYERNYANFLAPIKSLTFTSRAKKLHAKLSYKKAVHKLLVKLTTLLWNFCLPLLFQILQHSTNWGMDMFAVGELTNERPLTSICFTIFKVSHHLQSSSSLNPLEWNSQNFLRGCS